MMLEQEWNLVLGPSSLDVFVIRDRFNMLFLQDSKDFDFVGLLRVILIEDQLIYVIS